MLEGIKEKMLELLYDIEEEVGKDSKLYVHAYDVYADIDLFKNSIPVVNKISEEELLELKKAMVRNGSVVTFGNAEYQDVCTERGNDLSDEIFKEEAQDGM